ncbi:hypothetical protein YTPLAS18_11080 [Nitrospira sp.]|nr:hypothetical protein YTPLAS18_11080 [Nitrospira sp.]
MKRHRALHMIVLSLLFFPCLGTGCTIKATLDSTSDVVSNFLSSTSGHAWLTEDGLVREDMRTEVFVAANWANLQQNIAQSDGEYLSAFESLLAVPYSRRETFRQKAQQHLALLDSPGPNLAIFTDLMTTSARSLPPDGRP